MYYSYRPGVRNGRISRRPRLVAPAVSSCPVSRLVQVADHSLRLLLLLIGSGVLITVGFLFGLHQHFTVGAVGQAEVELRAQRDRLRSEQLYLELVRDQMLGLKELERQARQSKTIGPVKLDPPIASERERRKVR